MTTEPTSFDARLQLDEFIRAVGVRSNSEHALFLGAGASITSGVPSAGMCIWEWKRDIFLTNNPGLEDQFSELSLPSVTARIQQWLESKGGHPTAASDEEYSHYIEACFPLAESRRAYFQSKVEAARPHVGYRLTCALAEADIIRSVWTTNFDGLTARAAATFRLTPIEVGIDCQLRTIRQPSRGEVLCVSMHGDYRYDPLKNTEDELQAQETDLRQALIAATKDASLIVIGYSGRDHSVMDAFTEAYSMPGTGVLYWCGFGDEIPPSVNKLIGLARTNGRTAFFVPTFGFDDVMSRLARRCLSAEQRKKHEPLLAEAAQIAKSERAPFTIVNAPISGVIKSNAFGIEVPSEVFSVELKEWPQEKTWSWVKDVAHKAGFVAVPYRKKLPPTDVAAGADGFLRRVLALGLIDTVRDAFGDNLVGTVQRTPIGEDDIRHDDSVVMSLLLRTLVSALADRCKLETNRDDRLWETASYEKKTRDQKTYRLHRGVVVFLRRIARRMYVVLKPTVVVTNEQNEIAPKEESLAVKMDVLGWQHNREFNAEIDHWRQCLFPDHETVIEYPANCASPFRFKVSRSPDLAEIRDTSRSANFTNVTQFQSLLRHAGICVREPELRFSNADGTRVICDTHPLRGLVQNRPFDFPLTQRGLLATIRLGVICPKVESAMLAGYLGKSGSQSRPNAKEQDYLLPFPGFGQAFHVPLDIPTPGIPGWEYCPDIDPSSPADKGAIDCSRQIIRCVERLEATVQPDVVLIFVPERWRAYRKFETERETFDLHDFVKAYCIQKGLPTQFLEQDTLSSTQQCRVWWWLSVALYAKAMRTPWVLKSLAVDTAFVGLGYSIDKHAPRGSHILLGCCHLYNSQGQGLQYRLSKIEEPIMLKGNPFMSRDDAYRVGQTIRQLFFECHQKLPSRVVIHKLTPFLRDERDGLREGLEGVGELDLLELNVDDALRYVSSIPNPGGGLKPDPYPVRRGTVVKIDDYAALLWIHGSTEALQPGKKYFQGKRRIPAPIILRRHGGESDLATLSEEILGLSKMNWNSADLYSRLPATVDSSKQIAHLGPLLQRFGPLSYDYRLFM